MIVRRLGRQRRSARPFTNNYPSYKFFSYTFPNFTLNIFIELVFGNEIVFPKLKLLNKIT